MISAKTSKFSYVLLLASSLTAACKESSFSGSTGVRKPVQADATPQPTLPTTPSTVVTPTPTPTVFPSNAVTKGSFTVWAVPANPAPNQNYDIVINVKFPSNVLSYTESDLSGSILGTDNYSQTIAPKASIFSNSNQSFRYVPGSGNATLTVHVPGAMTKVRDTVNVGSTILKEAQSIIVLFQ